MLKIKDNINPEMLRKYGFKLGKEYADKGERCLEGLGYEYKHQWWIKFLMDEDDPDKIAYTSEEYSIPKIEIAFRFGENFKGDLYIDVSNEDTYHTSSFEADIIEDTIYELVKAGIIERKL